jgi:glutamate N-acetyltransferase/amino-acid N-acetyltransferase
MCELTGGALGIATADVLVCSTGLIGIPLPMAPIEAGVPKLAQQLRADETGGAAAAEAMLTTDTVRKEAYAEAEVGAGVTLRVGGMAKGAAMLAPAMATMLAVVATDVAIAPGALHTALERAVDTTFNALVVDGCTSTNDTVLVLANGSAGNAPIDGPGGHAYHAFAEALTAGGGGAPRRQGGGRQPARAVLALRL